MRRLLLTIALTLGIFPLAATASGTTIPEPLLEQEQTFLPVEEAYQLSLEKNPQGELALLFQIRDGYYLYGEKFKHALNGKHLPGSRSPGQIITDEYMGKTEVYYRQVLIELELPKKAQGTLAVSWQGCADAGLCYPPQTSHYRLSTSNGALEFSSVAPPVAGEPREYLQGWWISLLMAIAGGVILNLMPCVFPVLSLKVLSFAGKDPEAEHLKAHGLIYTLGVLTTFGLVALLLLTLRSGGEAVGWGFQLQSPWFVGLLAYLFLYLGMTLQGLVPSGSSLMGAGQSLTEHKGFRGTFFTGALAVVVASPCTAPFMGSAMAYAITQQTPVALSIFLALGFGMALPFLLLSFFPRLGRLLPRPGHWMELFKQILSVPLYLSALWLLWVLHNQTSIAGVAFVIAGMFLLLLALFTANKLQSRQGKLLALAPLLLAFALLAFPAERSGDRQSDGWLPYSPEELTRLRSQGKPVFLNVTADWCITCLANERTTLASNTVLQAFRQNGIVAIKADWTRQNPAISALLKRHGRAGVPLYLYFPPGAGQQPTKLPQILTPGTVVDTINENN